MAYRGQGYRHQQLQNVYNNQATRKREESRGIDGNSFVLQSIPPFIPHQASIPVHELKCLPFYDVLGELVKPSRFGSSNVKIETMFSFHLTKQQVEDIVMSHDLVKCEYTLQVQVRFCLLEQTDTIPFHITMQVNNELPLMDLVTERTVDITHLCELKPTKCNDVRLRVSYFTISFPIFSMSIYLVKKLSSVIVLQRLKKVGNHHSDNTKALIKEKFAQDPNSEIVTTGLTVSLLCPLSKTRMQIPCRASTCSHLQCFDGLTFLVLNEHNLTWMCPVCNQLIAYDTLLIDGYLVEILKQTLYCTDICFHEDGSWSVMKPQKDSLDANGLSPFSALFVPSSPSIDNDFVCIEEMNSLIIISDDDSD